MTKPVNEREIALAVLMEVTENGAYSHIVLREVRRNTSTLRSGKELLSPG